MFIHSEIKSIHTKVNPNQLIQILTYKEVPGRKFTKNKIC